MAPTAELRWAAGPGGAPVLQQRWVQHHIPAGATEAPSEWRDVPVTEASE